MTKDEATASIGGALSMLWAATVQHLNEAKIMYVVLAAVGAGTWNFLLYGQIEAWAGEIWVKKFQEEMTAPCYTDPLSPKYNPNSLACREERRSDQERDQTQAIQDLNARFDEYVTRQTEIDIKRSQELGQILKLLQPE